MTETLHPLVTRLLDGELSLGDLPPELRGEGAAALRLLGAARGSCDGGSAAACALADPARLAQTRGAAGHRAAAAGATLGRVGRRTGRRGRRRRASHPAAPSFGGRAAGAR